VPRKSFSGTQLANDLARLQAADKLSPPAPRPSLMDAVRAFTAFIETRASLGWTYPMIAAVLTEAGYPINAATLRSYRKRILEERRVETEILQELRPGLAPAASAKAPGLTVPSSSAPAATSTSETAPAQAGPAVTEPAADGTAPRAPPTTQSATRRSFGVHGNLPPDRA